MSDIYLELLEPTPIVLQQPGAIAIDTQKGTTTPTTRSDGSPLQVGDRFLHTPRLLWFVYRGDFWFSEQEFSFAFNRDNPLTETTFSGSFDVDQDFDLFLLKLVVKGYFTAPQDYGNYWALILSMDTASYQGMDVFQPLYAPASSNITGFSYDLFYHRAVSALNLLGYKIGVFKNGFSGQINNFSATLYYRLALGDGIDT